MLQKSARFILAVILALSMCPLLAFADEGSSGSAESSNPLQDLFYMVVGYEPDDGEMLQDASADLYPTELTAPGASSTLPDLSGAKDVLSGGILLGSGGFLYYLREATFESTSGQIGAYRTLERYNIAEGTWDTLANLPNWFEYCSAVIFGANDTSKGQIVLCGTRMTEDGGALAHGTESCIYTYNLDAEDEMGYWEFVSGEYSVPVAASLVNNGGVLEMVGGIKDGVPCRDITSYELYTGGTELVGELSSPVVGAQIISKDGTLYIYSYSSSLEELQNGTGSPKLSVFQNGSSTEYSSAFPGFAEPANLADYPSKKAAMSGSLTSADAGLVFVGPTSADNVSDTFLMDLNSSSFSPYFQTASQNFLSGTAACVYLGKLYALGSVLGAGDDGAATLVFRSTDMPDASIISGEGEVWRKDSTEGLDFVFTPEYGRFKHIVEVDGQPLILGRDYNSSAGTTIVTLLPEFLQTLEIGEHTLTAYWDDKFTSVSAKFTVEQSAAQMAEGGASGYTNPAPLARTFDPLPMMPIVGCAAFASALAFVSLRRVR